MPAGRWAGCATPEPSDNSPSAPTAALHPRHGRRLPQDERPVRQHQSLRNLIEAMRRRTAIPYWMDGAADVETEYNPSSMSPTPHRLLIVRWVKPASGSQLARRPTATMTITDREGDTLELPTTVRGQSAICPAGSSWLGPGPPVGARAMRR